MQPNLFDNPPKPRAKPRIIMFVYDAGLDGDCEAVCLECRKCGHKIEWQHVRTVTEAKRFPCPECNKGGSDATTEVQ